MLCHVIVTKKVFLLRCFVCHMYVTEGVDFRGKCQFDLFKQSKMVSYQSWPISFALLA